MCFTEPVFHFNLSSRRLRPKIFKMADLIGDSPSTSRRDDDLHPEVVPEMKTKSKNKNNKDGDTSEFVSRKEFDILNQSVNNLSTAMIDLTGNLKNYMAKDATSNTGEVPDSDNEDVEDDQNSDLNEQDQEDDSYFGHIFGIKEVVGPPIDTFIAKGITNVLELGLKPDIHTPLLDKHTAPSNCERLEVPKCNDLIFKQVSKHTRITDIRLQDIQKDLTKGISCIAHVMGNITDNENKKKLADALSLICNGSHSLDAFRLACFKPDLNKDYASLCTSTTKPIRNPLFGDLSEEAKEIAESVKITNKIKKRRVNTHPYKPFLGSGGPQGRRKSYNHGRPFNNFKKFNNTYRSNNSNSSSNYGNNYSNSSYGSNNNNFTFKKKKQERK